MNPYYKEDAPEVIGKELHDAILRSKDARIAELKKKVKKLKRVLTKRQGSSAVEQGVYIAPVAGSIPAPVTNNLRGKEKDT